MADVAAMGVQLLHGREFLVSSFDSGLRDAFGAVQDVDERRREVLVQIPWEVLDTYNSDFHRSCFDEYLGQRLPVMCYQHLKTEPIGRVTEWQKGARTNNFVSRFSDFDAVPRARQAFTQIRDGDLTDFSFYYDQATAIAHPNTRGAVRFVRARMPEISPVTVGSIPGAQAVGVRMDFDEVDSMLLDDDELRALRFGVPGYSAAELSALRRRQDVSLEVRLRDAFAKLDGRRSTVLTDADLRARAAALPPKPLTAEEQAQRRQLEISDRTPPDPNFLREYFGTDKPTQLPTGALMPETPPNDIMRAGVDAGMEPTEIVANWRKRWGKTDDIRQDSDAPSARHGFAKPYPPQDLIDAEVENGLHPAETIRRWRVRYGFES